MPAAASRETPRAWPEFEQNASSDARASVHGAGSARRPSDVFMKHAGRLSIMIIKRYQEGGFVRVRWRRLQVRLSLVHARHAISLPFSGLTRGYAARRAARRTLLKTPNTV